VSILSELSGGGALRDVDGTALAGAILQGANRTFLVPAALEAWPNTDFIQAYGLTELCGVISHLMPEDHRSENVERLSSAGTVVPNAEVRVVDPDTLEDVPSRRRRPRRSPRTAGSAPATSAASTTAATSSSRIV
jgi:acyl-CoA synthetase (AMP-forming)/AMP-acid ligase II